MVLRVIASSSAENAYILDAGEDMLLIESGVRHKRLMQEISFSLPRLRGALISHEHADHSRSVNELAGYGIDCYMSRGTKAALGIDSHRVKVCGDGDVLQIGNGAFSVACFKTIHDAAEPLGFLIRYNPTGEVLLFATDTVYMRVRPKGVHYFLVECDYQKEILERNVAEGLIDEAQRKRLVKSHMELDTLVEFFKAADLRETNNIVLLHLSDRNSNAGEMEQAIKAVTGIDTEVATAGMSIRLDIEPF